MSKGMQWALGIIAVLGLGAAITFLILWMKKKKENEEAGIVPVVSNSVVGGPTALVAPTPLVTSAVNAATAAQTVSTARMANKYGN